MLSGHKGITLAELLIALGIVALIAVFAIPKVLNAMTGDSERTARRNIHQVVQILIAAMSETRANGRLNADSSIGDLTPYLDYIRIQTSGQIDARPTQTSKSCSTGGSNDCFVFANGAVLHTGTANYAFGGTTTNRYVIFHVDPDGELKDPNAPSHSATKGVEFALYYDGRVRKFSECKEGDMTRINGVDTDWCPGWSGNDPDWFSWDM